MHSKLTRLRAALAEQLTGRILDCGSGDDLFGPILRRRGNDVISLDVDERALMKIPGKYVVASCTDIPFPDDSFDAVWSCAIIEHVREETLPEMIRVTRPGGWVIAITPNRYSPFDCLKRVAGMPTWSEPPSHVRMYDARELRRYGPVHGETWFVPFMGWFFWRVPELAHVLIVDIHVGGQVKERMKRRFPHLWRADRPHAPEIHEQRP